MNTKRTSWLWIGLAVAAAGLLTAGGQAQPPKVHAAGDGLAMTPPMGWYPWNEFGQEPQNETLIREIVDALVSSGLKDAGYAYVGPDEGICFTRGGGPQKSGWDNRKAFLTGESCRSRP